MSPKAKNLSFLKLDPSTPPHPSSKHLKEMVWFTDSEFNFPANEKLDSFKSYIMMPEKPVCLVCGRLGTAACIC